MFGFVPYTYTSWLTKEKKKLLSIQHFYSTLLPKGFHMQHPAGRNASAAQSHMAIRHNTWRQDARQAIPYAAERMREANVNRCSYQMWTLAKRSGRTFFLRSATGSLIPPKSLQSWHHILFQIECPGTLTLCCFIDVVSWWGKVTHMASLPDLPSRFRR